jgi:hypothetical protein
MLSLMKLDIDDTEVNVIKKGKEDYFSLTDMAKAKLRDACVANWLRSKKTLGMLGGWEYKNNPGFKYAEFGMFMNWAGTANFRISVKEWLERTKAIGLMAKPGKYGGTYAHKEIAFEFAAWVDPFFKLLLVGEYQRLKQEEQASTNFVTANYNY